MDPAKFYAVVGDQFVALGAGGAIAPELLAPLTAEIEAVLGEPVLKIGGWEERADGPLVLALTSTGQLVSVVVVNPAHTEPLADTLLSIDSWLAEMRLRDLSELSGNHVEFYEGLWQLSPDSSITLSSTRRYVLLTAAASVDYSVWADLLPEAEFVVRYLDVLDAPGGPSIVRLRDDSTAVPAMLGSTPDTNVDAPRAKEETLEITPPDPPVIEKPAVRVLTAPRLPDAIGLSDTRAATELTDVSDDPVIDLTSAEHVVASTTREPEIDRKEMPVDLVAGDTYSIDSLPQVFSPFGEGLEPISDALFAIGTSIALVVKLPERRRDTPLEERDRFRWDTDRHHIRLLSEYGKSPLNKQRTTYLFVESDRQPCYVVYLGAVHRIAFQASGKNEADTAWFRVSPPLDSELYRLIRKGRLPRHQESADESSLGA